jgi:hypothetical protein
MLSFSVAFTLLSGGFLHALIPHVHEHTGGELGLWGALHASLRHEDKKVFSMHVSTDFSAVFGSFVLALIMLHSRYSVRVAREFAQEHDSVHEAVRRGIMQYRRFG